MAEIVTNRSASPGLLSVPVQIVLLMGMMSTGCQPKNQYEKPPLPKVTVAHLSVEMVVASKEFTGTTEAVNLVDVRARVEGFLESIEYEEGKEVEKGDLLFTIDPRPFEAKLAQAKASVQLAHAQVASGRAEEKRALAEVANANAQLARSKKAAAQGAVTASEIDLRKTAVLTARAGVEAAKAAIASAQAEIAANEALVTQATLNLDYTKIRSPIKGRAGRGLVDVGNLVGSGESTLLTHLIQYDPIYVFFTINENDLLDFNRRHLAKASSSEEPADKEIKLDRKLFVGLGDEEGYPHEGHADYADLAVDQSTGTYTIRALVANPQRLIPPGAFIRVRVPMEEVEAMLIDPRAVSRDQGGAYLLIVNSENQVERRTITLGNSYHGKRAVMGPIGPEDRIIVNGLQRARIDAKVDPQMAASAADSKAERRPEPSPSSEAE